MRSTKCYVRVSLESGLSDRLEVERGLFVVGFDALSCPSANKTRWMDIEFCMPISSMINVWSMTLILGKGPIDISMNWFYVVVASLSGSLTKEVASGGVTT